MPRLTQAVPKYRKHKASGQAFVGINGRRHYLGPLWAEDLREHLVEMHARVGAKLDGVNQ